MTTNETYKTMMKKETKNNYKEALNHYRGL